MNSRYLPSNTVVAVSGGINEEAALDAVTRTLGGWKKRGSIARVSTLHA